MPSHRLTLIAVLALGLAVNASVERICLNACQCRLTLSLPTARLYATCEDYVEYPSINDANASVVLLPLGDGDPLNELKDFRCDNCHLDGIDHNEFEGVSDLDSDTLAGGVLVKLPTEALEGPSSVELQFTRSDIVDCDAFLKEFIGLRPKVKVVGCGDSDTDSNEDYALDEDPPKPKLLADNDTTLVEQNDTISITTPLDGRRRDAVGDIVVEDSGEVTIAPRIEGIQPLVPVIPDEDPATVFPPWTIAVIAIIGAIIVAVAGYYIWQKWTEIRSCCCGGEYQRP